MLRERRWLILGVTLAFTAVALFFDGRATRQYDAAATIEVQAESQPAVLYARRSRAPDAPEEQVLELRKVILPGAYAEAAKQLKRKHPELRLGGVPIIGPTGPGLFKIGIRHPDPRAGAIIANAIAEAVVDRSRKAEIASIEEAMDVARSKYRNSRDKGGKTGYDVALRDKYEIDIAVLRVRRATAEGAALIDPARPPTSASFTPGERVPPMFLLGISLALIAAFLIDVVDGRPRSASRLAAASGLPLAGVVPRLDRRGLVATAAFEQLRPAVEGLGPSRPQLVVVTSPGPGAGKSTVAAGLAEGAAAAGLRACLVEFDARRPLLARRLGLDGPGLTGVLAGSANLESALRRVETAGSRELAILPAGEPATRPDELFQPRRIHALVEELREDFELILLDCPPLPAGAEVTTLARRADAVLLCARAGRTTVEGLARSNAHLAQATPHCPVALVVSGASESAPDRREARSSPRARRFGLVPRLGRGG